MSELVTSVSPPLLITPFPLFHLGISPIPLNGILLKSSTASLRLMAFQYQM